MNNQLTIVGHVGQAPSVKVFADTGNKVVKFSVAVNEFHANKEKSTLWIDVDAWNGIGERVIKTITVGREVVLVGSLAIDEYTRTENGKKVEVSKPVLKLTSFHLCGPKPKSASDTATSNSNSNSSNSSSNTEEDDTESAA